MHHAGQHINHGPLCAPCLRRHSNPAAPFPTPRRFFQNQIRSEEEFQARKAELRAAARRKLDQVFASKGRHLIVDSDDDGFSIGSSELSAWDSDVASVGSLSSCVREWRREVHFGAPAEAALQIALVALVVGGRQGEWPPRAACMPQASLQRDSVLPRSLAHWPVDGLNKHAHLHAPCRPPPATAHGCRSRP